MYIVKIPEIKKYLYSIKDCVIFSFALFIISTYCGYIFAQYFPQETDEIVKELKSFFLPFEETTRLESLLFIFENNAVKLMIALLFGIFAGLVPMFSVFANGFILGILAKIVLEKVSLLFFVAGILPHGIIEIPAFIIASAIGIKIGKTAIWCLFGKSRKETLKEEIFKGLKFYILILTPLIFLAALIEVFVTPLVLLLVVPNYGITPLSFH